jgi:hypothetical protein
LITAGIILPFGILLFLSPRSAKSSSTLLKTEWIPPLPVWGLALLAAGAVYVRFTQLTTLSLWPLEDDAANAHYALNWLEKGKWQLTHGFSGMPPFYIWGLGVCLKLFGVGLWTLWFFPAFLSALAVGFVYAGARRLFSASFTLLLTGLMAFSFWPLYAGRFSAEGGCLLFWECVAFYFFARFWKASDDEKAGTALRLGLISGLGFYTFTSWSVLAVILTLVVFNQTVLERKKNWSLFLRFFIPQVLLFLPLGIVTALQRGGHFPFVLQNPLGGAWLGFNDFSSFFWGSRLTLNLFAYRPFWGGFLNPLLGALCFWGAVVFLRSQPLGSWWKWFGIFFLLILPGFITGGLDAHRVIQVLPFLLLAAAFGGVSLLSAISPGARVLALAVVMILSMGLDGRHLFGVYRGLWTQPGPWFASKSVERMRAYGILRELKEKQGPGLILSELVPDIFDQTLSIATYSFNAAENPKVPLESARWVAIFTNVHYQPYLAKTFPQAAWTWLAPDVGRPDGGFLLGVIPLPSAHPEILSRWIRANGTSHSLAGAVFDHHDWKSRAVVLKNLQALHFAFEGDRFLESCYWEKVAENEYADRNYEAQVEALRQALRKGYPAAHLYNGLGALLLRRSHLQEARDCFQKAVECKLNHTSAATALELMKQRENTGRPLRD